LGAFSHIVFSPKLNSVTTIIKVQEIALT